MQQIKVTLKKDAAFGWSYEDDDVEKKYMNVIEVTAMFIARLAATIQAEDIEGEDEKFEITIEKS